jgi:hypothetical protein
MSSVQINECFVSLLKKLIRDAYERSNNDPIMYRTKERIFAMCSMNPAKVIDRIGKVLFRYRECIIAGKDTCFEMNLKNDVTMDNFNDFDYINKKLGDIFQTLEEDDREVYRQYIYDMLELYIDYETVKASS